MIVSYSGFMAFIPKQQKKFLEVLQVRKKCFSEGDIQILGITKMGH